MSPDSPPTSLDELLTRLSVIRWFERPPHAELRAGRIASALEEHGRLLESAPPQACRVLSRSEGLEWLRDRKGFPATAWRKKLLDRADRAREDALASGRSQSHPVFASSGTAVSLRTPLLSPAPPTLERALGEAAPRPGKLALSVGDERLEWELGAYLLWGLVEDRLGPNPFDALVTVYEEGLYPLELLEEETAILWAPGLEIPSEETGD